MQTLEGKGGIVASGMHAFCSQRACGQSRPCPGAHTVFHCSSPWMSPPKVRERRSCVSECLFEMSKLESSRLARMGSPTVFLVLQRLLRRCFSQRVHAWPAFLGQLCGGLGKRFSTWRQRARKRIAGWSDIASGGLLVILSLIIIAQGSRRAPHSREARRRSLGR